MKPLTWLPAQVLDVACASARRWLAGGLCLLLGACASAPQQAHAHGQATHARSRAMLPGPGGAVPPDAPQRGGYYLDDGPGDGPPPQEPATVPDAVPRDEAMLPNANRPYEALGEVYFPDVSSEPYSERGLASWYGRRFHGHKTSSGEPYDMYAMTGAHKTLPIPSYARVTDVLTGKSVVVRINDRGPFHPGRVIDLSYTAAAKLGYAGRGSTEVLVERVFPAGLSDEPASAQRESGTSVVASAGSAHLPLTLPDSGVLTPVAPPAGASIVPPESAPASVRAGAAWLPANGSAAATSSAPPPTAPEDSVVGAGSLPPEVSTSTATPSGNGLFLQLGAFRNAANARQLLDRARAALHGLQSFLKLEVQGGLSRVRLGPFPSAKDQNAAAAAVERALNLKPGLVGP